MNIEAENPAIGFSVISIFPGMFEAITKYGVVGRAVDNGIVNVTPVDLRDYGLGQHRHLDDRPYGGGPGMVMMAKPIISCVSVLKKSLGDEVPVVYLSPQGQQLTHNHVLEFANQSKLILLCGRYSGVDQRALDIINAQEWSVGDYILSGGELAAMVLIDAVVRQIPGVLGNEESSQVESFSRGLLDCMHYTRPPSVQGRQVPKVLSSGNHEAIDYWRFKQSLGRTWLKRPDLLEDFELNIEQQKALEEYKQEFNNQRK